MIREGAVHGRSHRPDARDRAQVRLQAEAWAMSSLALVTDMTRQVPD